jgi:hypothetical protein
MKTPKDKEQATRKSKETALKNQISQMKGEEETGE